MSTTTKQLHVIERSEDFANLLMNYISWLQRLDQPINLTMQAERRRLIQLTEIYCKANQFDPASMMGVGRFVHPPIKCAELLRTPATEETA